MAAAVSGVAGFGGALLLLPLLTHTVGARAAVPLLTVAQRVGWRGWGQAFLFSFLLSIGAEADLLNN